MLELKTYKNYRELCKVMNWKVASSNSKTKQFKELDSLCKWRKEGNKIIIDEIYSEPKKIVDNRSNNGKTKILSQFKVPKEDWYKGGIYKIQFENKVYIGSTKDFRNRYKKHLREDEEELPHIWELLKEDNHTFEILEVVKDIKELNNKEQYYIDLYSKDNNYIVINKRRAFKEKHEAKNIKVSKEDYEKAIEILKREGIETD